MGLFERNDVLFLQHSPQKLHDPAVFRIFQKQHLLRSEKRINIKDTFFHDTAQGVFILNKYLDPFSFHQ